MVSDGTVDGDEGNLNFPYTKLGRMELENLMFVTFHMASMGSSSLMVGYHQDVSLAAHMMTRTGTFVEPELWETIARQVYELRWKDKYESYEAWLGFFRARCKEAGLSQYSGRCLYSALLPEDMQWSMDKAQVKNGILVSGTLTKRLASGSPSSIGMVMYRTYGADEVVDWLNASYNVMNTYLVRIGITLGISDVELPAELRERIDREIQTSLSRASLSYKSENEKNPVLRARKEAEILQDLNNIRERVAKMIVDYLSGVQTYNLDAGTRMLVYKRSFPADTVEGYPSTPIQQQVTIDGKQMELVEMLEIPVTGGQLLVDTYDGKVVYDGTTFPMDLYPRITFTSRGKRQTIDAKSPSQLLLMVKSGARGNETNAIQISGIIGQQAYDNGRIPRMMSGGTRSLPCYEFGDNSPESRGQILSSYLRGMTPAEYMMAHVASRENLSSNTDLTPKTGYYGRRLRIFLENLKITRMNGMQVVTNEQGVIVMWDFLFNPTHIFSLSVGGSTIRTFVDVAYEVRQIKQQKGPLAVYVPIPVLARMEDYLRVDRTIERLLRLYKGRRVILGLDPQVEELHPDVAEYLRDTYKGRIVTAPASLPPRQRAHWYMGFEEFGRILVHPVIRKVEKALEIPTGKGSHISVAGSTMYGVSYPVQGGKVISLNTLTSMLVQGTDFEKYPRIVQPSKEAFSMLKDHSLLETLILQGPIYSL